MINHISLDDCYARWDNSTLTVGNSKITRIFGLNKGNLRTIKMGIPNGPEFQMSNQCEESRITLQDRFINLAEKNQFTSLEIKAEVEKNPLRWDCLHVTVIFFGDENLSVKKHLYLWPNTPAIRSVLEIETLKSSSNLDYTSIDSLNFESKENFVEALVAQLHDFTDSTCHLVTENTYKDLGEAPVQAQASVVLLKEGQKGLFAYKEAPVSTSQMYPVYYDYQISKNLLEMIGSGFHNLPAGKSRKTYASIIGIFEGNLDDGILAYKQYQRARYKLEPERDYVITANSWGDFHEGINEEIMLKEIETAHELGLTNLEIDAGWSDIIDGSPDIVKFPNGLSPLVKSAKELGIKLGIWTSPLMMPQGEGILKDHSDWIATTNNFTPCDSLDYLQHLVTIDLCHPDCFNYLKSYYEWLYDLGIRRFKMDMYQMNTLNTPLGDLYDHAESFRRWMEQVELERPGMTFIQDSTRANRPVFDFYMDYGVIFLENRYQTWEGNGNYKPYKTLSSLWQLAPYIPPQKIEFELCNDEPDYSARYLLATVMFGNPLFWESLAAISEESKKELIPLLDLYKKHRDAIFRGHIFRMGDQPSGKSWTGLQSHQEDTEEGYLIVFREDNEESSYKFIPKFLSEPTKLISLTDDSGEIIVNNPKEGFTVSLDQPNSFRLYRYEPVR